MKNRYSIIIQSILSGLLFLSTQYAAADIINGPAPYLIRTGSSSTTIVAPADIAFIDTYQNATMQVTGGEISWLDLHDDSSAEISGGDISWLQLHDRSSVRLTGVDDLSWLVFYGEDSSAEIVANNVRYANGQLSGYWGDGTFFDFWAVAGHAGPYTAMPSNIVISALPEPSSALLLLGAVALLIAKRRGQRA